MASYLHNIFVDTVTYLIIAFLVFVYDLGWNGTIGSSIMPCVIRGILWFPLMLRGIVRFLGILFNEWNNT